MMIRYWNPAKEADSLSRQLDQLFDSFVGSAPASKVTTWSPAVEIKEVDDALVLTSFLPGVNADDLDIQVTRESISMTGQRKQPEMDEKTRRLYSDIRYGQFRRFIELPIAVQNSKVEASFEHGILTLTLPKVEEEKNKVVKLNLSVNDNSDS